MVTIKIHTPDGNAITIPDRESVIAVTKAEQSCALLGEDVVNISVESAVIINFQIGSYIDVFGKTYTLNQLPSVKKTASNRFSYALTFESEQYELMDCAWLLPENTYGDSFTGTLNDFATILIQDNIGRSRSDWTLGSVPDTEYKTLTYSSQNCLQVLQSLCKDFNVEFEILRNGTNRVLNFRAKVGTDFPHAFSYGRTGGAYAIERKTNTNQNVVTKLFAFGSSNNLGSGYRYSRLCLPEKTKNQSYITDENVVAIFGKRENVRTWDDIKPERTGEITADPQNYRTFTDSTMDFDLNETAEAGSTKWLINGTTAKVTFQTGNLAGYTFDLNSYNHATKTFVINTFTDENGLIFPNKDSEAFQFKRGDKYILTDILVPQSYIEDAENRLQTEAQKYFDEYCKPHVDYTISLNPLYLEGVSGGTENPFACGDRIQIIDADLGVDELIRITRFTRNIFEPYSYVLTLANNVAITTLERVIAGINENKERVVNITIANAQNSQRAWRQTQDVLGAVFDTEGHYFSEKIKPLSIETYMLAVGARSQQFTLKNVVIESNYETDANKVHSTAGTLEHYTIAEPETRVWNIAESSASGLDPNKVYYIYAKCEKVGNNGILEFTEVQHQPDEAGEYYYFLCGNLSTTINGARATALTYGSSTINGGFIRTGRIQSQDGKTYIDLDRNEIGGKMNFIDGLISEKIWIGADRASATGGIGGFNYDVDNLIWAYMIEKEGGLHDYALDITTSGVMQMHSLTGDLLLRFAPLAKSFWMKSLEVDSIVPKQIDIFDSDRHQKVAINDFGAFLLSDSKMQIASEKLLDSKGLSYMGRYVSRKQYVDSDGDIHYLQAVRCGNVVSITARLSSLDVNNGRIFPIPYGFEPADFAILQTSHSSVISGSRVIVIDDNGDVLQTNFADWSYVSGVYVARSDRKPPENLFVTN